MVLNFLTLKTFITRWGLREHHMFYHLPSNWNTAFIPNSRYFLEATIQKHSGWLPEQHSCFQFSSHTADFYPQVNVKHQKFPYKAAECKGEPNELSLLLSSPDQNCVWITKNSDSILHFLDNQRIFASYASYPRPSMSIECVSMPFHRKVHPCTFANSPS